MVIKYYKAPFEFGAEDMNLLSLHLFHEASDFSHSRSDVYYMMIKPPSLLPDISRDRAELLAEEW